MRDHGLDNITPAALDAYAGTADPRQRELFAALIKHLHAFAREVELKPAEWQAAVDFLAGTARFCTPERNEFIILSDILGLSMLVDGINGQRPPQATPSTVLGPFHAPAADMPAGGVIARPEDGMPCVMSGTVRMLDGTPIAGAVVDLWEANEHGHYDVTDPDQPAGNLRGKFRTDARGHYAAVGVKPAGYGIPTDGPTGILLRAAGRSDHRPGHIHALVSAPGHRDLVTHIFVAGDPHLDSDPVFGTKEALIVPFTWIDGPSNTVPAVSGPHWAVTYDFVLAPQKA